MNFTKRYFKLRDDIVQAINDSALPVLAAEQCLRELRGELLAVVERELRVEANEEQGGNARQLGNENTSPHQSPAATASPRGEAMGGADVAAEQNVQPFPSSGASRHLTPKGKARGGAGTAETASPRGEADGRTESSAPTEAGKEG